MEITERFGTIDLEEGEGLLTARWSLVVQLQGLSPAGEECPVAYISYSNQQNVQTARGLSATSYQEIKARE